MRNVSLLLLLTLIGAALASCGAPGPGADGTPQAPSNAVRVSIAYSPEKEAWLKDRIAAFNATETKVGNQPIFVEGINKSSGAARTEIRSGQLKVTVWSPSASTMYGSDGSSA